MKRTFSSLLIFLFISAAALGTPALEGQIDLTFNPNVLGTEWRVSHVAAIGQYVYVASASISRLRSDGTVDDSYRCDLAASLIKAIRPAADGGLIVAGMGYIVKLDADGKIDPRFVMNQFRMLPPSMGESRGPYIYDCAVDSKGRIVVQGMFAPINGSYSLARLLPDGTVDPDFHPPTDIMASAMVVMPDDRIWVTAYNDGSGRLNEDGTRDLDAHIGTGSIMRLLPDGTVAVADRSVYLYDQTGRWLSSFKMDFSFDFGIDDVLWDHGKIVVSGEWIETTQNGRHIAHAGVIRFNPDGTRDPTWEPPDFTFIDFNQIPTVSRVEHLALDSQGRVIASCRTPIPVGTTQTALVRLTANAPTERPLWYGTSARGTVSPGEPLIVGFSIGGRDRRLLLRAVGPSLARFGCGSPLPQPRLAVYRGNALILQKSGWSDSAEYREAIAATGEFPFDNASADTATIATLPPGVYTLVISTPDGAGGVALGEVYALDAP